MSITFLVLITSFFTHYKFSLLFLNKILKDNLYFVNMFLHIVDKIIPFLYFKILNLLIDLHLVQLIKYLQL